MKPYAETVRAILEEAGRLAIAIRAEGLQVEWKPDGTPVTNADKAVGDFLTAALIAAYPGTAVVSEEQADTSGVHAELTWMIDPIDGTRKYVAGRNLWCVMVALVDTVPRFTMIYYPEGPVWYWAENGTGAWFEEKGVRARLKLPEQASSARVARDPACTVEIGEATSHGIMKHARKILWGKLDVYLREHAGYWDLVPPMLILEEAGAKVVDFSGRPLELVASNAYAPDVIIGQPVAVDDVVKQIRKNDFS